MKRQCQRGPHQGRPNRYDPNRPDWAAVHRPPVLRGLVPAAGASLFGELLARLLALALRRRA